MAHPAAQGAGHGGASVQPAAPYSIALPAAPCEWSVGRLYPPPGVAALPQRPMLLHHAIGIQYPQAARQRPGEPPKGLAVG